MIYTAQTLYPATSAGEGTNNKKIQDASTGGNNTTTTCAFGLTTTVRYILAKPLTVNSTSATPAPAQDFGWNVLKADMNPTGSFSPKRIIPSGTWTFHCTLTASTADTASFNYTVKVYVHKRSSTGALTELFNTESTAAGITTTNNVTMSKSGVSEIILNTDETIHAEYWVQGRGGGSTGLIDQTITFNVGTPTGFQELDIVVPTPGIRTRYYSSLSVLCAGISAAIKKARLTRSVAALGVVTFIRRAMIRRTVSLLCIGVASIRKKLPKTLSSVGVCVVQSYIKLLFSKLPTTGGQTYSRSNVVNK